MKVLSGTTCNRLAADVAAKLGTELASVEIRRFPDGDLFVRCADDLAGRTAAIVQSPFQDAGIVEHRLLQAAARSAGASRVVSIAPYTSYSRQDKAFNRGEATSAREIVSWLASGCDSLVTIDLHNPATLAGIGNARNVIPSTSIAEFLRGRADAVLAPDKGALVRAEEVARKLGVRCDHIEKRRIDDRTVEMRAASLDVAGLRVAIVDDIISTGGTMAKARAALVEKGAKEVYAVATHGMFSEQDLSSLKARVDLVAVTGSLETEASVIDLSGEIAQLLRVV